MRVLALSNCTLATQDNLTFAHFSAMPNLECVGWRRSLLSPVT